MNSGGKGKTWGEPGLTITGFQHLAVAPKATLKRLVELQTTMLGYEIIRDQNG